MLWLALYLPQLPLEVFTRARQRADAFAVIDSEGGRERVSRCNAAAQACGIRPGHGLSEALALYGALSLQARDRPREAQALQELAAWAYQFSARLAFGPSLLLIEVDGSRRLFGGLAPLLARVEREIGQLGYSVQHALAPTPAAAGLLARQRPGCRVRDTVDLATAVDTIPVAWLTRERGVRELVRHIGLETLGEVLRLPRPELARRAGPGLIRLLDRLLGRVPDPQEAWQPPRRFAQRLELLGEIGQSSALVFPARRLIVALCGFLRGCGGGAQQLCWQLAHRERPRTDIVQGLLDPSRDPDHMLEMFRERIERVVLPAPVVSIGLRVDTWLTYEERSAGLFDINPAGRGLLERLGNRLGEAHVRSLRCVPDHRPERAWQWCEPGEGGGGADAGCDHHLAQPAWLLTQPRPLQAPQDVPLYGGPLRLQQPPQRIESGWWDGGDVARDYFVALSPAGERLWVFRDRRGGGWYLHGLFM
jgi:protein ImuB